MTEQKTMELDYNKVAELRHDSHGDNATPRINPNKPYEEDKIGMAGELEFARMFGLSVNTENLPAGDNGVDFTVNGKTIDVKTSPAAGNLLIKPKDINRLADILVLVKYTKEKCFVIGWATKEEMQAANKKVFNPMFGESYYIKASDLRSVESLIKYIAELRT